ncbi:hypothetical protein MP228_011619 [Amoeboaphelidium protococcarum]|nr:hypothetical protein MP228_011619 [Amoeboaphelidium protococcarum]
MAKRTRTFDDIDNDTDYFAGPRQSSHSLNTQRSTDQWVRKFEAYLTAKRVTYCTDWFRSSEGKKTFTNLFSNFVEKVKKENGEYYTADSLKTGVFALIRYFKDQVPDVLLYFNNDHLLTSNLRTLDKTMKKLQGMGLGLRKQARVLSDAEWTALVRKQDADTPSGLLNLVVLHLSLHFAFRGQEHVEVMRSLLKKHETGGIVHYQYTIPVEKNNQGGLHGNYEPRVCNIPPGSAKDSIQFRPVDLIDKYLSVQPESPPDRLFLQPMNSKSGVVWYKRQPIGVNGFGYILKQCVEECGLQSHITWHTIRATGITSLAQRRVSEQLIKQYSGHRSYTAVPEYTRRTADDKMNVARLLQSSNIATGQVTEQDILALIHEEDQPCLEQDAVATAMNEVSQNINSTSLAEVVNTAQSAAVQTAAQPAAVSTAYSPSLEPVYTALPIITQPHPQVSTSLVGSGSKFASNINYPSENEQDNWNQLQQRVKRQRITTSETVDNRSLVNKYRNKSSIVKNAQNKIIFSGNGTTINMNLHFHN